MADQHQTTTMPTDQSPTEPRWGAMREVGGRT